jgi:hypothetical protein
MSTTSFGDIDKEAKETPAENEVSKPQEPQTGGAVATQRSEGPAAEDINIDHLQIYGKSSHFDPEGGELGDICINKETPLAHVGDPLRAVVVHARKYWKENIPYGDQTTPRFANTIEEKSDLAADSSFGVVPVCDITVLVERPESFTDDEEASSIFLYEFGGKEFALVKYTVQKSQAVRENYGTINTQIRARATKGVDATGYYFNLSSIEKGKGTQFSWHQFILKGTNKEAPEEAFEFAQSLRGA